MDALSTTSTLLPPAFLCGAAAGAAGYGLSWLLFKLGLSAFATDSLNKKLASLDEKSRLFYLSLAPSTAHAIAQCLGTYGTVLRSVPHRSDPAGYFDDRLLVEGGVPGPAFYSGVFVGYLLADFVGVGPRHLGAVFSVHHLSASVTWILCSAKGLQQWYASFLQFNELSTLWVNLRQVLLTAGYPSSGSHVTVASLGMFLTFGAVRVAPLPLLLKWWVTRDYFRVRDIAGTGVAVASSVSLAVHVALQGYWFSLMVKKFLSVLLGGKWGTESKKKRD